MMALLFARTAFAGGSGLNVMVVVNQNSTNSVQLGNYYLEKRQIEPQNLVRINWTGGNTVWDKTNFESVLLPPLQAAIASRGLSNQIDLVVLSMDIPYAVSSTNGYNSTTAVLYYGFKPDGCTMSCPGGLASCSLPFPATNYYAAQEDIFRNVGPGINRSNVMAMMLTSDSLADAKLIVDHGVTSDSTFPTQAVVLAKSSDTGRNIRYREFDDTVFNAQVRGNYAVARTNNSSTPWGLNNLLGYENGLYQFTISPNTFVPGAMADSLTSYGGVIFGPNDQTTAMFFLNAGAAGSYGTVVEPCAYLEKFPSSQNYFYQCRGFGIAESYYQSLEYPYQGIMLGEPLAAPFAQPANGSWNNLTSTSVLRGTTNLSLQFIAADTTRPLNQIDLFLDGVWLQTLTNIPPKQGNVLYVSANGATTNLAIPASATIKTVASNLMMTLNRPYFTNTAKVQAFHFGDRIELRSVDINTPGALVSLSVSNSVGTATDLRTFASAAHSSFLDTTAWGYRSYIISGSVASNDFLHLSVTKTNGTVVTVTATNLLIGAALTTFAQQLLDAINTNVDLQGPDALTGEDLVAFSTTVVEFNLRARGIGIHAAQIQANLSGSYTFQPSGTAR
ncbi:MAG TPA: TIGR03790 family protein, partial [Verrucomicrobiae bacterium]|nr:TIGR03790 family protein [Verrucomicrobiae bacterium]